MTTSFEELGFVQSKEKTDLNKFKGLGFKPVFGKGERKKVEKAVKGFKFFGLQPTPEQFQKIRKPIKQEVILPLIEFFAGRLGMPGDISEGLQKLLGVKEPIRTFPPREQLKGFAEAASGEEFRPETPGQQQRADLASLVGALSPGGLGKALVGGLAGTGAAGLAEKSGLGPVGSAIAGGIGTLIPALAGRPGIRKVPKKPSVKKALEVAEKEGIKIPKAALKEELKEGLLKQAKPTKLTKVRKLEFEKSVEKAKDKIIAGITPSAKTEKEALALKEAAGDLFKKSTAEASEIVGSVPTKTLQSSINKAIQSLERTPALATEEASTLTFLRKLDKGLESKDNLSNLMSLNKSLNKEINFLKPTSSGDRALISVKEALKKDIELVGKRNPEFFRAWKKANSDFSQSQKFLQMREALSPAFNEKGLDFNKFENIFTNVKKERQLRKLFGKEDYSRLKNISKLSKKGEDVFKLLTQDTRFFRQVERFSNFAALNAVISGLALGKPGVAAAAVPIVAAEKIGIALYRGYMGRLMTNNKFQKDHLNLLKALKSQNKRAIITTMKRVNDNLSTTKKDIED